MGLSPGSLWSRPKTIPFATLAKTAYASLGGKLGFRYPLIEAFGISPSACENMGNLVSLVEGT